MGKMRLGKGKRWLLRFIVLLAFPSFFSLPTQARIVRIGVLAIRGAAPARAKWQPTANYLSRKLGDHFEIVPLDFAQIVPAVKLHKVDFLIANPSIYVEMENRYGLSRIATMKALGTGGKPLTVFGGVIFCRADSPVKNLRDLKGKSFMAVDRTSLGGWQTALLEFKKRGINPERGFFSRLSFGGTHDAVVHAVARGKVDAGTIRTDVLEQMAAKGIIRLGDFRVLGRRRYKNFPYLISTSLYPEWPFAKLRQTPDTLARKAALALFGMNCRHAPQTGVLGWTVPLDYSPVYGLLRDLRMGPYEGYGGITLAGAIRRHLAWFLALSAALGLLIAAAAYVDMLNRRLLKSGAELEAAKRDLEQKVKERTEELEAVNQNLRESEGRFRAMIEAEPQCVKLLDREGNLLSMNPAGLALIEAESFEQVKGAKVFDMIAPECRPAFRVLMEKVFGGEHGTLECNIIGLRGTKRTMTSSFVPFKDAKGDISAILCISMDITERKELEEQLRQAQKMDAVGQLAGGIAHDFNNILSAIIGYADLVKMKLGEAPPAHYVDQILSASHKAANLVQGLLAFSRKQVMSLKPVDINELIRNFEKFLLRLIREDIELVIKCAGALVVMADSAQIEQVLMNLATNSRDAMPDGGRLVIETSEVQVSEEKSPAGNFPKPDPYALIMVTDTGAGMNQRVRERVFDPFFTTKETGKGTGLGLSIIYGIIKQHGGLINVQSEPGRGTRFEIFLPLARTQPGLAEQPEKEEQCPLCGEESILVAEDDPALRQLTRTVLTEHGYKVIEAENGQDAVDKFLQNRGAVNLLVMDVIMPRKNGKEAYEEIKKISPSAKAVFISGYSADIINGTSADTNFIAKPVSPNSLLKKVRETLDSPA